MLVDVSAFLTSATVNAVSEAFSVPELQPRVVAVAGVVVTDEQRTFQAALDAPRGLPDPVSAPDPAEVVRVGATTPADIVPAERVPASRLPSLRGMALLQQLPLLSRSELAAFASKHADVLAKLSAHAPAATEVTAWWAGIPSSKQAALAGAAPGVIGNLEGVPYRVRDQANRTYLADAEKQVRDQVQAGSGRAMSAQLDRRLHMLEQVHQALARGSSHNPRELIGLDPTGDGTAVIVIGDATDADYVGYLIPGMFSSVDTQIVKFAESADQIATDQQRWLDELDGKDAPTAAVVAWIGYHTPNLANVASLDLARQAESALTSSVAGLRAIRGDHQPFVSVMAHSYGSTAALLALQDGGMKVDALAIVGSPGSPAQDVGQLDVTNGNVWVGAADWDPVPDTGLFGSQPTAASYGALQFGVGGVRDPESGTRLGAAVSHNDYFVPGTESLRNIELIGIGRGDLVLAPNGNLALSGKKPATKY